MGSGFAKTRTVEKTEHARTCIPYHPEQDQGNGGKASHLPILAGTERLRQNHGDAWFVEGLLQNARCAYSVKVGPDYLDTGSFVHTAICGVASRNLDGFMLPPPDFSTPYLRTNAAGGYRCH